MRRYYPGITIFKLAGAVLVLLAHIMLNRYMGLMPEQHVLQFVMLNLRVIVPCFYVIAGFLAYKGWVNASDPKAYIRRYITRIMMMYSFFCLLFVAEYIIPALLSNGLSLANLFLQAKILFMTVFLNGPYIQLWFIPPLLFGIIVSYWFFEKQYYRFLIYLTLIGFFISQLLSGSLRPILVAILGNGIMEDSTILSYIVLFVSRYFGFGLTFVFVGVILAKSEDKFLRSNWRIILYAGLFLAVIESIWLINRSEWNTNYTLVFSILPNTIIVFYGVLHLRSQSIQVYHKAINRFSIVTFCCHIPFMKLNLFVLGWVTVSMSVLQDLVYLLLTFIQCLAVTLLITHRKKIITHLQARKLSS